jgi:hypothetical protein
VVFFACVTAAPRFPISLITAGNTRDRYSALSMSANRALDDDV